MIVLGKGWWNVETIFLADSKEVVIIGHETQFDQRSIVLPCCSNKHLSCNSMQSSLQAIKNQLQSDRLAYLFIRKLQYLTSCL